MINDPRNGGLKMIHLYSFNKSLETTWVKKYLDTTNKGKWKLLFDMQLENYGCQNLFRGNLNVIDTRKMMKVTDPFLKEIVEYWAETKFERQVTSEINLREQSLWFNSLIRVDNKPIFVKDWLEKGITKVKHLRRKTTDFCPQEPSCPLMLLLQSMTQNYFVLVSMAYYQL